MFKIYDKEFKYIPSFSTDLAQRFREVIEQQRVNAAAVAQASLKLAPVLMVAFPKPAPGRQLHA